MTKAEQQNLWAARVEEFRMSGQSVPAWCTDHDLKPHQLRYWLRKKVRTSSETTFSWLTLDLSEADFQSSLLLRVGQVVLEVRPGFDPKLLLDVVKTLILQ